MMVWRRLGLAYPSNDTEYKLPMSGRHYYLNYSRARACCACSMCRMGLLLIYSPGGINPNKKFMVLAYATCLGTIFTTSGIALSYRFEVFNIAAFGLLKLPCLVLLSVKD